MSLLFLRIAVTFFIVFLVMFFVPNYRHSGKEDPEWVKLIGGGSFIAASVFIFISFLLFIWGY